MGRHREATIRLYVGEEIEYELEMEYNEVDSDPDVGIFGVGVEDWNILSVTGIISQIDVDPETFQKNLTDAEQDQIMEVLTARANEPEYEDPDWDR